MKKLDSDISYSIDCFKLNFVIPAHLVLDSQEEISLNLIVSFLSKAERDNPEETSFREAFCLLPGKPSFLDLPKIVFILMLADISIEYGAEYLYLVWNGRKFYNPLPE